MAAAIFSLVSCLSWFYRSLSWNWFCHCVHWVHLTKNVCISLIRPMFECRLGKQGATIV
jgi:hypothetical protein